MYEIYKLKEYDTISDIADRYNTTEEELIKINGINKINNLQTTNELIVPQNKNNNYEYYTVKKEDNIYQIATKYNIDYNILLKINGLEKDDYIYPNQTLLIPSKNINMYITEQGDTINKIINTLNTNINEILEKNKNILLEAEQIIFFKEK